MRIGANLGALLAMAMAAEGMGGHTPSPRHVSINPGSCRNPRNLNNDPDRAPGMRPYDIDGKIIYAGSPKAARKKARLLKLNTEQ